MYEKLKEFLAQFGIDLDMLLAIGVRIGLPALMLALGFWLKSVSY